MEHTEHTQSTAPLILSDDNDSIHSVLNIDGYHDDDEYGRISGSKVPNSCFCNCGNDSSNKRCYQCRHQRPFSTLKRLLPFGHYIYDNNNNDDAHKHDILKAILIGQLLSIANSCTGAASTTLETTCGINSPTAQSGFMYVGLSLFLFLLPRVQNDDSVIIHTDTEDNSTDVVSLGNKIVSEEERQSNSTEVRCYPHRFPFTKIQLRAPWYYYALLSFFDLEANFLTYSAYRYTSFTSISLLASLCIPSAMVFSSIFLKRKYNTRHFIGVVLCFIGFILTLGSDVDTSGVGNDDDDNGNEEISSNFFTIYDGNTTLPSLDDKGETYENTFPFAIRGDILAALGAIFYGLNDTLTERSVKKFSFIEFLAMLGFFGTIFSVIQILLFEPQDLAIFSHFESSSSLLASASSFQTDVNTISPSCSSLTALLLLIWNTFSLLMYYIGASYFLLYNDAALLDVSLLTTNLYAICFEVFTQNSIPSRPWLYFMAVTLVISGVFVYEMGSSVWLHKEINSSDNDDGCSKNDNIAVSGETNLECIGNQQKNTGGEIKPRGTGDYGAILN